MKIKELQDGSKKVEVVGRVVEIDEEATDGAGWQRRNCRINDDSGHILLVLWDEQTQQVSLDDTVKIENGYVKAYKGTLQLQTGKWGKLTVLDSQPMEPKRPQDVARPQNFTKRLPENTIIEVEYSRKICPVQYESLGVGASVKVPVTLRDSAYLMLVDFVEEKLQKVQQK